MIKEDNKEERTDLFLIWEWKEEEHFIKELFTNKDYKFFNESSVW